MYNPNSWEDRLARSHPTLYAFIEGAVFFLAIITMSIFIYIMAGDV